MSQTTGMMLSEVHEELWAGLVRATVDRRHGWHLIAIATVAQDGDGVCWPDARTVVLRRAIPERRVLMAHTDRRTEKVEHLIENPRCVVLAYDAKAKQQLRLRCRGVVHLEGEVFERQWAGSKPMSRRCYLAPVAPGTPAEGPMANLPEDLLDCEPDAARSEGGRANFAVVELLVERIDWLWLAHDGHRRASFVHGLDGSSDAPEMRWLAP